ncbi:FGGY family carbohydrate kinase [Paraburkholderia phymatum]|uniref:Carbohydrate kinase FGGY n=1 Tax=Paraburkholderia phymatum (strain DSM 17167 / CIP 108236 / LMG 21445 / STM815) TaxID=391038 RepID=B2JDF7_PARP8|nr:FGGY family carbohydrate kinase [Paraburkholderia phymatum]ACC69674.1 carbohydrate kinase FGGY [Paraburkholderia phymatum STM815]
MSFLGIDLGTGSLKLAIIDDEGREQCSTSIAYAIDTPHPGWAEIDPLIWWRALCEAAARFPDAQRSAVRAIGFSGQMHGVVLSDAHGNAVRPAMLWPDTRALSLLDAWPAPQPNPVAPGMAGPLLRWVALHEPQSILAARWAMQPKDWVRLKLGGAIASDPSDACATALAEPSGAWDRALLDRLGLPGEWFAPLAPSYAAGGTLSDEAAQALGLPAGVLLATGAGDTPCAALGSGLTGDGDALLTTGTGGQILVLATDEPDAVPGLHRYRAATDHWYRMAAMQNVGVALEAVRGWLSYEWQHAYRDAFESDVSPGLTFLPYLTGERTPWLNPAARGGWLGLALGTSRGAMMRAAFEGVAFSLRAGLDSIRQSGARVSALRLAGGGSVDPRWRQLLANALQVELHAVDCPNAAARGAALLGGIAAGHWHAGDLAALAPAATRVAGPQGDAQLAARYARFIDLYGRVEPWFAQLSR